MSETETETAEETTETTEEEGQDQGAEETEAPESEPDLLFDDDKDGTDKEEGELKYAGKFKTVEDLEKGFNEAQKLLQTERDIPDEYLYENSIKDAGLDIGDAEAWESDMSELRDNGFSQKQVDFMLSKLGGLLHAERQASGPPMDLATEQEGIKEVWGDDFQAKSDELKTWIKSGRIHPDIYKKPLGLTKEGWMFLEQMMINERGPNPLVGTNPKVQSLDADLAIIHADPVYNESTNAGEALRKKALELVERQRRLSGN